MSLDESLDALPSPKKRGHGEHNLQVAVKKFCGEVITVPFLFLAFDRSRKQSQFQHMYEKARGVTAGTPDCLLMVRGSPGVWCELKFGKNPVTQSQERIGAQIQEVGRFWDVCRSVTEFHTLLLRAQIPLRSNSALIAEHRDRLLAAPRIQAARVNGARGGRPKRAKPRVTLADVARQIRMLPK